MKTKELVQIPVETIKQVVVWIWKNKSWIIPTTVELYKIVKGWFKKPKKQNT